VIGIENGDSTGKSVVFAGSSKENHRRRCNETFISMLEGSHQLVTVSGHGKRNSWKRGAFMIGEELVGHTRVKKTFEHK
jgi:hypothetical protein